MTGNLEIELLMKDVRKSRDRLLGAKDELAKQIIDLHDRVNEKNFGKIKKAEKLANAIRDYAYTTEHLIEKLYEEIENQIAKTAEAQRKKDFYLNAYIQVNKEYLSIIEIWTNKLGSKKSKV